MGVFLERLILEDFRNFKRRTEIEFSSPITAIVGKNFTGKSSVLSAIDYMHPPRDKKYEEKEKIGLIECVVNGKRLKYGKDKLQDMSIRVLKLRSTRGVSENIFVHYESKGSPDFIRIIKTFNLTNPEDIEHLNENCCRIYGFELELEDKDKERLLAFAVFSDGRRIPANNLSPGIQSLLALESILLASKRNTKWKYLILLEEMENFLHPSQLKKVIKDLKNISRKEEYQIILTTHSPFVVSMLSPESIIKISPGGRIYQVKGVSRKIVEDWEKLLDPPKSEIFFADKVIIYEGITDKFIIEGALGSEGVDLNREDVVSIKLDGLYHYESITRILRSFGIPYLAIVDKDPKGRLEENLEGEYITLINPYGEIEDAVPLEDWIRILENNDRDAEIWFLINLLDYYLGRENSFGRFSDAVARSFGKNKISYAYRLGKLYEELSGVKDRGVGTFVRAVEDFIAGRDINIELKEVDKDILSKNILVVDESLGLSKEEIVNFLYEEGLFPDEILPFMVNGKHYGLMARRAVPVMLEARVPFVAVLGKDYDIDRAYRYLSSAGKADVGYKDSGTLEISVDGIRSFITVRQKLSIEDLGGLADFSV